MTTTDTDRVSMPAGWLWLFRLGCPAVGFALGFVVRPIVEWATSTLDSAPAPLRLAAELPQVGLVPILTIVGVGAGLWLARAAAHDSLTVTVDDDGLILEHGDTDRYVQRERVDSVFTDPKELVVLDPGGRELFRASATDLSPDRLAAALRRHNYPWHGNRDPHEHEYRRWIDGHPDLDEHTNSLFRARSQALTANDGAQAENIHTQLQDNGIAVRDRDRKQQYRLLT